MDLQGFVQGRAGYFSGALAVSHLLCYQPSDPCCLKIHSTFALQYLKSRSLGWSSGGGN